MRRPLELSYDPDCNCDGGVVFLRRTMGDGNAIVSNNPTLCSCVKPGPTKPVRLPCPNCGGLAVLEGCCVGCALQRPFA